MTAARRSDLQRQLPQRYLLDTSQLDHFKRVFDLDSQTPYGAYDFGVAQQQLY